MENLTPLTRLEQFLAKIAGDDIELPEVKTRLEYWLKEISENGGGGGGGSSGLVVEAVVESPEVIRLNKTMKEIMTAVQNAQPVYLKLIEGEDVRFGAISACGVDPTGEYGYGVSFDIGGLFTCDNENDYPTFNGGK